MLISKQSPDELAMSLMLVVAGTKLDDLARPTSSPHRSARSSQNGL